MVPFHLSPDVIGICHLYFGLDSAIAWVQQQLNALAKRT
jgi:hypothetical protein